MSRTPVLAIEYDRPLSPRALALGAVLLRSGDRSFRLALRFDPARRMLEARPERELEPEVEYRLEVGALDDLDGQPSEPFVLRFSTGLEAIPSPPAAGSWAEAGAALEVGGCGGCHAGASAPLGLDLSSAEGVRTTAIGVPAREVRAAGEPASTTAGLVGLPRVAPGAPERSYLVYKLLGDPHILGGRMPLGEAPLPPEAIEAIVRWIASGAPVE